MTVVVMFGSPNSLNKRNDNSMIRSRVRRGALCCMLAVFPLLPGSADNDSRAP
jgi:hypothetical protein